MPGTLHWQTAMAGGATGEKENKLLLICWTKIISKYLFFCPQLNVALTPHRSRIFSANRDCYKNPQRVKVLRTWSNIEKEDLKRSGQNHLDQWMEIGLSRYSRVHVDYNLKPLNLLHKQSCLQKFPVAQNI